MGSDDEDNDLFRRAMDDVRPLRKDRADTQRPRRPPRAAFRRADERQVLADSLEGEIEPDELESGEELVYRSESVKLADFRRLRRGQIRVGEEVDLHGLSAADARAALHAFLDEARDRRERCVRVIHGKGLRSGHQGPVIKRRIGRWLRRRDDVLAYCSARPVDGGTGALYVLLRRAR